MTASSATPLLRSVSRTAGMRASTKANRSRILTGEVWWLKPMTNSGISGIVNSGKETESPKRQEDEREAAHCSPGETSTGLSKAPMQHEQPQIKSPNSD